MDSLLDPTNIKILNLLQQNARLQVKEISMLVHKSEHPVHERIRKLQNAGFILRLLPSLTEEWSSGPHSWSPPFGSTATTVGLGPTFFNNKSSN